MNKFKLAPALHPPSSTQRPRLVSWGWEVRRPHKTLIMQENSIASWVMGGVRRIVASNFSRRLNYRSIKRFFPSPLFTLRFDSRDSSSFVVVLKWKIDNFKELRIFMRLTIYRPRWKRAHSRHGFVQRSPAGRELSRFSALLYSNLYGITRQMLISRKIIEDWHLFLSLCCGMLWSCDVKWAGPRIKVGNSWGFTIAAILLPLKIRQLRQPTRSTRKAKIQNVIINVSGQANLSKV